MSDDQIVESIHLRGYPDDLTDDEIRESIKHALRELKFEYPIVAFGTFDTVQDQQIYDLFNPVRYEPTSQGIFPGGLRVLEIVGGDGSCATSLSVFGIAPWIQGFSFSFGTTYRNTFYTPGDWTLWDLNWAAFTQRFTPMEFEHTESRPGSPIQLYPRPSGGHQVLCRFSMPRTLDLLRDEDEAWFLQLCEGQCCFTLANKFSPAAGIRIGDTEDKGLRKAHWTSEGNRKWAEGWNTFERRRIDSVRPERRSH